MDILMNAAQHLDDLQRLVHVALHVNLAFLSHKHLRTHRTLWRVVETGAQRRNAVQLHHVVKTIVSVVAKERKQQRAHFHAIPRVLTNTLQ